MIVSVSRRTDIPRYYMPWFASRLKEGYALVRNPMNRAQISRIPLSPNVVDCLVFWTKDAAPLLHHSAALKAYSHYTQFTITAQNAALEPGLPGVDDRVETFRRLAAKGGPHSVVWRYSPAFLGGQHTEEWHLENFAKLAGALRGHTLHCRLSFLDVYGKIEKNIRAMGYAAAPNEQKQRLAKQFMAIAAQNGIQLSACGDACLLAVGIPQAKCVDDAIVSAVAGFDVRLGKDTGQRLTCGCVPSVDIGTYNTCPGGCVYCYANQNTTSAQKAFAAHDEKSPLLCGNLLPGEVPTTRTAKTLRPAPKRGGPLPGQLTLGGD